MIYDLSSELHRKSFQAKVDYLLEKGACVDIKEKAFRTPNQNRYLHLLLGVVAMETGNTLEDVKREYFKNLVNPEIFRTYKTDTRGNTIAVFRSTTQVSKEEMSQAIDKFKQWGYHNGFHMPNPEDLSLLKQIEFEMGRMQNYL